MTDQRPSELEKEEILTRLRRVEGQLRGIQRMIAEDRGCEAIVTQMMAARAALDRVSLMVITHHIEQCLLDPARQANRDRLERVIGFFLKFSTPALEPSELSSEVDDAS